MAFSAARTARPELVEGARAWAAFDKLWPSGIKRVNTLLLVMPAALLLGALGFQYVGGLVPCEMCLWQRWPHLAAVVLALAALVAPPSVRRVLLIVAAAAVLTSGAIGAFHMGVERHWWTGPSHCTPVVGTGGDFLRTMVGAPLVRCDVAAWSLLGVSMAGWNAAVSGAIGLFAFSRLVRR